MPRLKGSADLLEDRRKRALALLDSGHSLNEVGRRIRCHASSVMRWRDARRRGGAKGVAGALFSGAAAEAGPQATKTLGGFASARTARAWLSDQSVDDGAHCGTDPSGVPGSVSSRPCRPVDAPLAMEPAETGTARTGAG